MQVKFRSYFSGKKWVLWAGKYGKLLLEGEFWYYHHIEFYKYVDQILLFQMGGCLVILSIWLHGAELLLGKIIITC